MFQRCRFRNHTVFLQTTNQTSLTRNTNFIIFFQKKKTKHDKIFITSHSDLKRLRSSFTLDVFFRWCFTLLPWDSSPWLSAAFGVEIFVGSRGFFHPHIFFAQQIQGGPLRVMEVKSSFLPIQSHPFFWVVATQIFFIFTADPWGRWTQFDEHIFQMGWFNHQPVLDIKKKKRFSYPWRDPWDVTGNIYLHFCWVDLFLWVFM